MCDVFPIFSLQTIAFGEDNLPHTQPGVQPLVKLIKNIQTLRVVQIREDGNLSQVQRTLSLEVQ